MLEVDVQFLLMADFRIPRYTILTLYHTSRLPTRPDYIEKPSYMHIRGSGRYFRALASL